MITKRTQRFAIIAVIVLLLGGGLVGGMYYLIVDAERSFTAAHEQLEEAEHQIRAANNLEDLVTNTDQERSELREYVLAEEDVIDFLTRVENTGARLGTELTTRSLDVVGREGPFEELAVTVDIVGSEEAVWTALEALETLPYQSRLEAVEMRRTSGPAGVGWESVIEIRVTKFTES